MISGTAESCGMSVEYEGPGATEIMVVSKTNGDSVSELRTIAFVVATLALGLSGDGTDVVSSIARTQ